MRISESKIYCSELWWYGVDKNGYIFACTTGGQPNIPEFVCCNNEETVFLDRFFIFDFDKEKNSPDYYDPIPEEEFEKLVLDDFFDDNNILLALKGITSFDIVLEYLFDKENEKDIQNNHKYYYKKITKPAKLLHINQLPKNIQKIMDSHRMNDVDVTTTNYFFVEPNPNY